MRFCAISVIFLVRVIFAQTSNVLICCGFQQYAISVNEAIGDEHGDLG